ncbi:cellulase family glycosylhydrolase, partial [Mesorhizobium marinum]|uniref:cellulase family glycosylhydrolase n=1 Tax=Mesorhizobium marinum TaxID=3228790 RepID=UPI00346632FC
MRDLHDLPFPLDADDPGLPAIVAGLHKAGHDQAAAALERSLETPWDARAIAAAFDTMAAWSVRHGQPVIVNEFGVLAYHAPRPSRLAWLAAVRAAAEQRCIGWTHWDFQVGFGLMDPATGMPD